MCMLCNLFNRGPKPVAEMPAHVTKPVEDAFAMLTSFRTQAEDWLKCNDTALSGWSYDSRSDWQARLDLLVRATGALREVMDGRR